MREKMNCVPGSRLSDLKAQEPFASLPEGKQQCRYPFVGHVAQHA